MLRVCTEGTIGGQLLLTVRNSAAVTVLDMTGVFNGFSLHVCKGP